MTPTTARAHQPALVLPDGWASGQPAELAPIYVFLASQESSYITGEVVGVTGGRPLS
jgi:NAD(P)-dependent dehydrogenase (short-subunit alcohol dehydrogenase family)